MGGAADGFLYRGGQIQVFDFGTSFTQLNDIGNNGLIVGNYGYEGFVLNPDTGERSNFTVNQYQTIARSVNSAGDLVGSFFAGGRTQSYVRHQDGSIEVFPFPTAYDMGAMGVNDSGDIVGISGSSAFLIRGAVPPPVVQNVSEPESLALMLVGLSMLGLSVRRKNIQSGGRHRSTALA